MKKIILAIFIFMMMGMSFAAQSPEKMLLAKGQICQRVYDNQSTVVCDKYPGYNV